MQYQKTNTACDLLKLSFDKKSAFLKGVTLGSTIGIQFLKHKHKQWASDPDV